MAFGGLAMDHTAFLTILSIGAIAGWLAGQVARSADFHRLADIIAGIAGALAAGVLVPQGGFMGGGFPTNAVAATLGAVALLLLRRLVRRA